MDTHCAPLVAEIFIYSYEAEFIQSLLSIRRTQLASQCNFTYRYIDDVLPVNDQDLKIIWVGCILLSLSSQYDGEQPFFLLEFLFFDREVCFALPFTVNVTILTPIP